MTITAQRKRAPATRPPPPTFSLSELADDAQLTQYEVAQVKRQTLSWTEKCRLDGSDNLEWVYVGSNKRPRCIAGSLKKDVAGSPDKAPQDERLRRAQSTEPKPPRRGKKGA
jgi:hypothetical protein